MEYRVVKLDPLSMMMLCGTPKRWMRPATNFTIVLASAFVTHLASIYLVNIMSILHHVFVLLFIMFYP